MLHYEIQPPRATGNGYHVLVLHGLGDSMEGWKPAVPLFASDQLGWCFVNAPEAYGPYGGYSWFDLGPDMAPDLAGVGLSRHLLELTIAELLTKLDIPAEKLILMGFSQGCLMVLDQALRGERRFAGIVGISGWVNGIDDFPAAFGPQAREQRILMTHGRFDELLPIELVRMQAEQLRELGVSLTWSEYDKTHTLDPEEEAPDIRAFLDRCCR
jgi:phospholipase/carboxylesterase